jgi:FKBP-type peptidyl-prolyl cis-trans isomerase 2
MDLGNIYRFSWPYLADSMANVVSKGSTVKVEYIAKVDGKVVDKSEGNGPLEFTAGAGQLIEGFDEAVMGMKLGDEKTVTVPPEKAYGPKGSGHELSGKTMVFWIKVVGIN